MSDRLVLCYHAVSEHWPAPLAVTPARLERQLGLLVRRGYRGVTFHRAVTDPPSGRCVAVTFDDAFRSVRQLAEPILARLGLPGTVFVPTAFVAAGGATLSWPGIDSWVGGAHEHELAGMSWEELDSLASGGWEIGSHTQSHPRLTQMDAETLEAELVGSRDACEQALGRACRTLAYPYGDFDTRVAAAARRAGYEAAGTLPARLGGREPLEWPRVGIYRVDDDRRFRMKISRPLRMLRATPLWPDRAAAAT